MSLRKKCLNGVKFGIMTVLATPFSPSLAIEKLDYDEFIRRVGRGSGAVKVETAELNSAVEEVKKSGRLSDPQISLSRERVPFSTEHGKPSSAEWNLSLTQAWPWPGTLNYESRAAESRLEASKAEYAEAETARHFEAASAIIDLAAMQQKLKVERDSLKEAEAIAKYSQAQLSHGLGSHLDALQSRNDLEVLRANISTLESIYLNAHDAVLLLAGLMPGEAVLEGSLEKLESTATLVNVKQGDLVTQGLEASASADVARLEAERKRTMPEFMTSAMLMRDAAGMTMYGAMLGIRVPLFSSGTRSAIDTQSSLKIQKKAAELTLHEQKKVLAKTQLERALKQASSGLEVIRKTLVPNTRSHLATAITDYGEGRGDVRQVIDSRKALLAFSMAEIDFRAALLRLKVDFARLHAGFTDEVLNVAIPEISGGAISGGMAPMQKMSSKSSVKRKRSIEEKPTKRREESETPTAPSGGMGGMGGM